MTNLVRFEKREQATERLVCVPYAGASAAVYRLWNSLVPATIELCVLDIPGRGYMKRPPAPDMASLVDEVYPALLEVQDKPYTLYGHSFGSAIAYAVALRAQRDGDGRPPQRLVVSGRRAPHIPSRYAAVNDLSDAAFIDVMQQRYKAFPESVLKEKELLAMLLPIFRADIRLNETYCASPAEKFHLPIRLLYGKDDTTATQEDLMKWSELTDSGFESQAFPGGHFFIDSVTDQVIPAILRAIGPPGTL